MQAAAYQSIPIVDCLELLVAIDRAFARFTPHPYVVLGAPYGQSADGVLASPWRLRQGVHAALQMAQTELQRHQPGWRLQLFDAWRPLAVQAFMVWREFALQASALGLGAELERQSCVSHEDLQRQAPALHEQLAPRVFEFWSPPSHDPRTPPPHSTGAAVDVTLMDEGGQTLDMGSAIDETSVRAYPQHYATASDSHGRACHRRRELLAVVMQEAGFVQHPNEWWHFSLGDQLWAWLRGAACAHYGRTGAV